MRQRTRMRGFPRGGGASAGAAPFNPISLSPSIWLKADVGTYQSAGTATPAVADGDPVRFWQDQSGNANNSSQATASQRPALRTNVKNGLPAVQFDGVDDFFSFTSVAPTAFSAFFAASQTGDNLLIGRTDASFPQIRIGESANKLSAYDAGAAQAVSTTLGTVQGNWSIIEYVFGAGTLSFFQGGVSYGSGAVTSFSFNELSGAVNGILPINGYLGEFLLFPTALSAPNRVLMETYLKGRWATP